MSVRPITVRLRASGNKSKSAVTQGGRGAALGEVQALGSVGCRGGSP